MENFIGSRSGSFEPENAPLNWQKVSSHCPDIHDPPVTACGEFLNTQSPPRRWAPVIKLGAQGKPPSGVIFPGEVIWRRRLPWLAVYNGCSHPHGEDRLRKDWRDEGWHDEQGNYSQARLGATKTDYDVRMSCCGQKAGFIPGVLSHAALVELTGKPNGSTKYFRMSKGSLIPDVKSELSCPGTDPGKDVRMPNTAAVVQLPEILRSKSSHLVKLAGKIDSFSLMLRETPDGELKHSIEEQFHAMVLATRKEIRKYCPRYRSLPGEGILDFNTDCTSGQLEPGDLGKAPPPKRGMLCCSCRFFAGIPEEQVSESILPVMPQDLVFAV